MKNRLRVKRRSSKCVTKSVRYLEDKEKDEDEHYLHEDSQDIIFFFLF